MTEPIYSDSFSLQKEVLRRKVLRWKVLRLKESELESRNLKEIIMDYHFEMGKVLGSLIRSLD